MTRSTFVKRISGTALICGSVYTFVNILGITNGGIGMKTALVVSIMTTVLWPLYYLRPRPVGALVFDTHRRIGLGCVLLLLVPSAVGRSAFELVEIAVVGLLLASVLPAWFRMQDLCLSSRSIVVGDDSRLISEAATSLPNVPIGYVSPRPRTGTPILQSAADEGTLQDCIADRDAPDLQRASVGRSDDRYSDEISRIAGLTRLRKIIRERNVDIVAVAFRETDREEFFGVLETCSEIGVDSVLVHERHADDVLLRDDTAGTLVPVAIDPWPWYNRAVKRGFDIVLSGAGLLVLAPLTLTIAVVIHMNSPGGIFYRQQRTGRFGDTFQLLKFRTMLPDDEAVSHDTDADRITRPGRILRRTHLDEIPQLISILVGHMSVVGPRPAITELEHVLDDTEGWRQRWHVKPGLTGLAQINDADSLEPERKLAFDLEYVRNQSLALDTRLFLHQIWIVIVDTVYGLSGDA